VPVRGCASQTESSVDDNMTYARLEDTVPDDVRFDRLARELGVRRAEAVGLVHTLWAKALIGASDGDLGDLEPVEIERWCSWEGDPNRLFDALRNKKIQFLSKKTGRIVIEDWERIAEGLKRAEWKRAERQRKSTKPVARHVERQSGDSRPDVAPDLIGADADQNRAEQKGAELSARDRAPATAPAAAPAAATSAATTTTATGGDAGCLEFPTADGGVYFVDPSKYAEGYRSLDVAGVLGKLLTKVQTGAIDPPSFAEYPRAIAGWLDREFIPSRHVDRRAGDVDLPSVPFEKSQHPAIVESRRAGGLTSIRNALPELVKNEDEPDGPGRKIILAAGKSARRVRPRGMRSTRHALRRGQLWLFPIE
jgi:hypothetical protein